MCKIKENHLEYIEEVQIARVNDGYMLNVTSISGNGLRPVEKQELIESPVLQSKIDAFFTGFKTKFLAENGKNPSVEDMLRAYNKDMYV